MSFLFGTTYSLVWLIPIILVAALATYYLYYQRIKTESLFKWQVYILSVFRFFVLLSIGFLFLNPIIKTIKQHIQKPVIVFAQDNSHSMVLSNDSVFIQESLPNILNPLFSNLANKYDVRRLQFGDSIAQLNPSFTDSETNFEQLFSEFSTTYFNQNIGALVIVSDGIFNAGNQPIYEARDLSFPIYTIPLGDTIQHTDVSVAKTEHNAVVYLGSKFPVRVGVSANMLQGEEIKVEILCNDKLIAEQNIVANNNTFYKNIPFFIDADSAGVFEYEIKVSVPKTEINTYNNSKYIYVEVEKDKRKILLFQNGYHPDIAAISSVIDMNPAFELKLADKRSVNIDFKDIALVILHQLPSNENSLQTVLPLIVENGIPMLFIIGNETSIKSLNNLKIQLEIDQKNNLFDEVLPGVNSNFNLFNVTANELFVSEMTPLHVPFGNYNSFQRNKVLFYQKIGQIETGKPLWAFADYGKQKVGFIMGEGLWKWRIQEYKSFRDHSITNELIVKTIQYLALKNKKNAFVVDFLKTINANQQIVMNAKLLNASNELVKSAEINLELIDEEGNKYPHVFKEIDHEYTLNIGLLEVGEYSFIAKTQLGDSNYTKTGTFIVKENLKEQSNLLADYNMLFKLSENSGGKQYSKANIPELFSEIENNSNIVSLEFSQKILNDLINLKSILIALLLILSLEWFLRKYWGLI
ncbi:MAG: hypothetical protein PF517_21250 [Salinivirgaceae bacterium]|nr:hypothetical protein [Salinivirgaceae bacterium]